MVGKCPTPPKAKPDQHVQYEWPFQLGQTAIEKLLDLQFGLGDHGHSLFSLREACGIDLNSDWRLNVTIVYNSTNGVFLHFDDKYPVFTAMSGLDIDAKEGCSAAGKFAFIGANITVNPKKTKLEVDAKVVKNSDGKFSGAVEVVAELDVEAELGFTNHGGVSEQALEVYPHFNIGSLYGQWGYVIGNGNVTKPPAPTLNFTHAKFCVGSLVAKVLKNTFGKLEHILHPVDEILGKDGVLTKQITAAKYVFGSPMSVIQLAHAYCGSHCVFDGVFDMIKFVSEIDQLIEDIGSWADAMSADGCAAYQLSPNFTVDFSVPKVPKIHIPDIHIPNFDLHFKAGFPSTHIDIISKPWKKIMEEKGSFGFDFNMYKNLPEDIVKLMIGVNFPVFGVDFPVFTLGASKEWEIDLCAWASVNVGLSFTITMDVGELALTSKNLIKALETGQLGKLVDSIGYPTVRSDGTTRYPLKASGTISGGLSVNVGIFIEVRLGGGVDLTLWGGLTFVDIYGDGWVTIGEIEWMVNRNGIWGALDKHLELDFDVYFQVQLCVDLIFHTFCWTVFRVEPVHAELWHEDFIPSFVPKLASSSGALSLAALSEYSQDWMGCFDEERVCALPLSYTDAFTPIVEVYDANATDPNDVNVILDYYPGQSNISTGMLLQPASCTVPTSQITYDGTTTTNFILRVRSRAHVTFPPMATLEIPQSTYNTSTFAVGQLVQPTGYAGVDVTGGCRTINLTSPNFGGHVIVSRAQCPIGIQSTATSNVSIEGTPSDYGTTNQIDVLGEALSVSSTVSAQRLVVTSNKIVGDGGIYAANLPQYLMNLDVQCTSELDCLMEIANVSDFQRVQGTGGHPNTGFLLDLKSLLGAVNIDGGAGVNNMTITIANSSGGSTYASAYSNSIVLQPPGPIGTVGVSRSVVTFSNIQRQGYRVEASPDSSNTFVVGSPYSGTLVQIDSVGASGSSTEMQLFGCDSGAEIRVNLTSGGSHTVRLGGGGTLANSQCPITVGSDTADSDSKLVVQSFRDDRPLVLNLEGGHLSVFDPSGLGGWLTVSFYNISVLELQLSNGTEVTVGSGLAGTDVLLLFPNATTSMNSSLMHANSTSHCDEFTSSVKTYSLVNIHSTDTNVFVDGVANVSFGQNGSTPLANVDTMVAISSQLSCNTIPSASLHMASATSSIAPDQRFRVTSRCISELDINHTSRPVPAASSYFCDYMLSKGFSSCTPCQVAYSGPLDLFVGTGSGSDYFEGVNVSQFSHVAVNMSQSSHTFDTVVWAFAPSNTSASFWYDGRANLTAVMPIEGNVSTTMGAGATHTDVADLWYGTLSPAPDISPDGTTVAPLAPENRGQLRFSFQIDHTRLLAGWPTGWKPGSAGSNVVAAENLTPKAKPSVAVATLKPKVAKSNVMYASVDALYILAHSNGNDMNLFQGSVGTETVVHFDDSNHHGVGHQTTTHHSGAVERVLSSMNRLHDPTNIVISSDDCNNPANEVRLFINTTLTTDQIVVIGNGTFPPCTVRLTGALNSTLSVIVDASSLPDASFGRQVWKVVGGALSVWPADGTNTSEPSNVQVYGAAATVLVNGSYGDIGLGPKRSALSSESPLNNIGAVVAASRWVATNGSVEAANIVDVLIDSGTGPAAPAQHLSVNGTCIRDPTRKGTLQPVSSWMCSQLQQSGFSDCSNIGACAFTFVDRIHFTHEANGTADVSVWNATNFSVFDIRLHGDSNLSYGLARNGVNLSTTLRGQSVRVNVILPCGAEQNGGSVNVDWGTTTSNNLGVIWTGDMTTSPNKPSQGLYEPLCEAGSALNSYAYFQPVNSRNFVRIKSGFPNSTTLQAVEDEFRALTAQNDRGSIPDPSPTLKLRENYSHCMLNTDAVTHWNFPSPHDLQVEDVLSNNKYIISEIGAQTTVQLFADGTSGSGAPPATNFEVVVELAAVNEPAAVEVFAKNAADYTVVVNIPPLGDAALQYVSGNVSGFSNGLFGDSSSPISYDVLVYRGSGGPDTFGGISVGGLDVRGMYCSQIILNMTAASAAAGRPLRTLIQGSPSDADIFIFGNGPTAPVFYDSSFSSTLILTGGVAMVPSSSVTANNGTTMASGQNAAVFIDAPDGTDLSIDAEGCIKTTPAQTSTASAKQPSKWLSACAGGFGLNASALLSSSPRCIAGLRNVSLANVSVANLTVTGTTLGTTTNALELALPSSHLQINGGSNAHPRWSTVSALSNEMQVAWSSGSASIAAAAGCSVLVDAEMLVDGDGSSVTVDCGAAEASPVNWALGASAAQAILAYTAPGCAGSIVCDQKRQPKVALVDTSSANEMCEVELEISLSQDTFNVGNGTRNLTIGDTGIVLINDQGFRMVDVEYSSSQVDVAATITTSDGTNFLNYTSQDGLQPPSVMIAHAATTQLFSPLTNGIFEFSTLSGDPSCAMVFDASHRSLQFLAPSAPDNATTCSTCLNPIDDCSNSSWARRTSQTGTIELPQRCAANQTVVFRATITDDSYVHCSDVGSTATGAEMDVSWDENDWAGADSLIWIVGLMGFAWICGMVAALLHTPAHESIYFAKDEIDDAERDGGLEQSLLEAGQDAPREPRRPPEWSLPFVSTSLFVLVTLAALSSHAMVSDGLAGLSNAATCFIFLQFSSSSDIESNYMSQEDVIWGVIGTLVFGAILSTVARTILSREEKKRDGPVGWCSSSLLVQGWLGRTQHMVTIILLPYLLYNAGATASEQSWYWLSFTIAIILALGLVPFFDAGYPSYASVNLFNFVGQFWALLCMSSLAIMARPQLDIAANWSSNVRIGVIGVIFVAACAGFLCEPVRAYLREKTRSWASIISIVEISTVALFVCLGITFAVLCGIDSTQWETEQTTGIVTTEDISSAVAYSIWALWLTCALLIDAARVVRFFLSPDTLTSDFKCGRPKCNLRRTGRKATTDGEDVDDDASSLSVEHSR